jgi:hypothetical protein
MKFMNARCTVCGSDIFREDQLLAFNSGRPLERVDLEGQQPWCGVTCICLYCATMMSAFLKEFFDAS